MTKTKTSESRGDFNSLESESRRSFFQPKTKSHRWAYTQPDLTRPCFICDSQIKVITKLELNASILKLKFLK